MFCQLRQTWMFVSELKMPNTFNSQIINTITTIIFKILLIFLSIGIKLLTSQSNTPAMITMIKTFNNDIFLLDLNCYTDLFLLERMIKTPPTNKATPTKGDHRIG